MQELEMVPVLCWRALEGRMMRGRMRRFADRAGQVLRRRQEDLEGRVERWSRTTLGRRDTLRLLEYAQQGRLEVEHLERCLGALRSWAAGGPDRELHRALVAWDAAHRCWSRALRAMVDLAPGLEAA